MFYQIGELIVPALTVLSTLGLLGWFLARRLGLSTFASRLLVTLVVGVVSFQVAHFFEHILQPAFSHSL